MNIYMNSKFCLSVCLFGSPLTWATLILHRHIIPFWHQMILGLKICPSSAAWTSSTGICVEPKLADMPFEFKRLQLPVWVSFAMFETQGQSLEIVGVHLMHHCFSHGQFYVGCYRLGIGNNLFLLIPNGKTKNVVYPAAIQWSPNDPYKLFHTNDTVPYKLLFDINLRWQDTNKCFIIFADF